jgi:hypothetical protein
MATPDPNDSGVALGPSGGGSPRNTKRLALRLALVPLLAIGGVLIFQGLRDRLTLPDCDSGRAKQTLSDILKEFKYEPLRDQPIKTISTSKEQVVCNAVLAEPDGSTIVIDYRFYWQAGTATVQYSISRRAAASG